MNLIQSPDSKGCCSSSTRNRKISNIQKTEVYGEHPHIHPLDDRFNLKCKFRGRQQRKCAALASTHYNLVQEKDERFPLTGTGCWGGGCPLLILLGAPPDTRAPDADLIGEDRVSILLQKKATQWFS